MHQHTSFSICALALLSLTNLVRAHTVITYPGWRGNTLHSNGTVVETNGIQPYFAPNGTGPLFPYGMQWTYPCGGMPMSQNRTKWPVKGGAVAFQPGWFQGHSSAYIYINIGFGEVPLNYSSVMYQGLQIVGPTNQAYPGTFCLPQVPLPANHTVNVGDKATIQLVEAAVHGAALYNCVDIEFAEPEDVAEVNEDNCFNSSQIDVHLVFTTSSLTAGASDVRALSKYTYLSAFIAMAYVLVYV